MAAKPRVVGTTAGFSPVILDNNRFNPLRSFSLFLGLALVFLRVSAFHQVQTVLMHANLKLLYVVGIPALTGTVLCGGLPRAFKKSPTWYWIGFGVWMSVACLASTWRSDSVLRITLPYLRTNIIFMVIVAGLIVGWKECVSLMRCLAFSAFATLLVARLFQNATDAYGDRFTLDFGTVSNSNDFACHLAFCLPFLYWAVLSSKSIVIKLISLAGIAYAVLVIFRTGSRGGLIAIIAMCIAFMLWSSTAQRLALLIIAPIVCIGVISIVPHQTLMRIVSFSAGEAQASAEALESSAQRRYLLQKSIEYTFKFPLFGVGPGEFASYEGGHNEVIGAHGTWHATHNSFTEVSSECGIPGLLFYVAGLVASFRVFYSTYKRARPRADCVDIKNAMFCLMICMVGYCVATFFLNFAYFFYPVLLGGFAVVVASAMNEEFARRDAVAASRPVELWQVPGLQNSWVRTATGVV